jgi:hypothetical protein
VNLTIDCSKQWFKGSHEKRHIKRAIEQETINDALSLEYAKPRVLKNQLAMPSRRALDSDSALQSPIKPVPLSSKQWKQHLLQPILIELYWHECWSCSIC